MMHALHTIVHVVGTVVLIAWAGLLVAALEYSRQQWLAGRRRPRIEQAPIERPVPPWSLAKPDLEVWLEARAAAARAEEEEEEDD